MATPAVTPVADACTRIESQVNASVSRLSSTESQLTLIHAIHRDALAGTRECPKSTRLWYLAARTSEILERIGEEDTSPGEDTLEVVLRNAHAKVPASKEVSVVAARVEGDLVQARGLLATYPDYWPARALVSDLLVSSRSCEEAVTVSESLPRTPEAMISRASALYCAGRPGEALKLLVAVRSTERSEQLTPTALLAARLGVLKSRVLRSLGRVAAAKAAERAALAATPQEALAYSTELDRAPVR
jgi:hypothetical protein